MRKRMFRQGKPIESINELLECLDDTGYVFQFGRPKHRGWIESYRFRYLMCLIRGKTLHKAELNDD